MNNFYTLIYLKHEIKEKIQGGKFSRAISPHKDVLHIYITRNKEEFRLIFSTDPRETALFWDRYRPPKKRNVIDFFTQLVGNKVTDITLADKDRLVTVYFDSEQKLLFKLFSGRPNVFLVEDGRVFDAFKNPEELKDTNPPVPEVPEFKEEISPRRSAKNQMTEANPLLPRNLLPLIVEQHQVDEMQPEEVKAFTAKLTHALKEDPHPRVLKNGDFCLWSNEWLDMPHEKECGTVNDCVSFAYKNAVHLRRLHNKKEDVIRFLKRIEHQSEKQIQKLQQADERLERAQKYKKYGHLLMIHAHEDLPIGTDEIELKDIYEDNQIVTIALSEGHDLAR